VSGRGAVAVVLALGLLARLAYVWRPLDHRLAASWRQSDYTQVTRNFWRDGLDILHPRIDWRGDAPGYAEMELPLLPWVAAAIDRVAGYHEQTLRALAAVCGTLGLVVFWGLARRLLPAGGRLVALAAFAANPLLVYLSTAMQPEALAVLAALLAVGCLWRFDREERWAWLVAAAAAAALAILAKATSVYLGLVIAWVLLRRMGLRALVAPRVWGCALLAVVPGAAWYWWAHRFWLRWGLSLGVSNESHWIGLDMLFPPRFLIGILKWETIGVLTPIGWVLAAGALARLRDEGTRLALVWYGAVWVFYLAAARTTGDDWAFYYHSASVAPACLLMGAGFVALRTWPRTSAALVAGTLAALVAVNALLVHRRDGREDLRAMRECALAFVPLVPPDAKIVVDGGTMHDEYGLPVAHNASTLFAWMDRKGFNYGSEELSVATLDGIAARGGRYWIAGPGELDRGGLRAAVEARYRLVARCPAGYALYDLASRP